MFEEDLGPALLIRVETYGAIISPLLGTFVEGAESNSIRGFAGLEAMAERSAWAVGRGLVGFLAALGACFASGFGGAARPGEEVAVGQNQEDPILGYTHFGAYFSGDWDVHWGYGMLTHGQVTDRRKDLRRTWLERHMAPLGLVKTAGGASAYR